MCLAIPMRLIAIDGAAGTVEQGGVTRTVGLDFIEQPAVGEYLIIHAGFAISRVDEAEAQETLELFRQIDEAGRA